jgi:hypothetical protein
LPTAFLSPVLTLGGSAFNLFPVFSFVFQPTPPLFLLELYFWPNTPFVKRKHREKKGLCHQQNPLFQFQSKALSVPVLENARRMLR